MDVIKRRREVLFVPYEPIKIVHIPKRAIPPQYFVGPLCGVGLPRMHDARQGVIVPQGDKDVDVIGHDDPPMQVISFAIEVPQRIAYQGRDLRVV